MNRVRTLLKFSFPARAVTKNLRYFTSKSCDSPLIQEEKQEEKSYWKKLEPGFVSLTCSDRTTEDYSLSYTNGSDPIFKAIFCPLTKTATCYRMTNSCDGLIGVYTHDILWIANPSTGKLTSFVKRNETLRAEDALCRQNMPHAAIGFDEREGVYKAVEIFRYVDEGRKLGPIGCQVRTLTLKHEQHEDDLGWQFLQDPPSLVLMKDQLPVTANRYVYWTLEPKYSRRKFKRRPGVALSYDLVEEEFRVVLHPEEGYWINGTSRVVALGGRTCLVDTRPGRMTVWALEDCVNSEWSKLYDIDLSRFDESGYLPSYKLIPLAVDEERIVFYYGQDGRREYYDVSIASFLEQETVNDVVDLEFVAPYAGSKVWSMWRDSPREVAMG